MNRGKRLSPQAVRHTSRIAKLTAIEEQDLALPTAGTGRTVTGFESCSHVSYPAPA
jgi:hypothetical protein